jgi:hypothetical protein
MSNLYKFSSQYIQLPTHDKQGVCNKLGYQSTYYQYNKTLQDSDKGFFKWLSENQDKIEEAKSLVSPLFYKWYEGVNREPHPDTINDTIELLPPKTKSEELDWYKKLNVKLESIQLGELSLNDYKKSVERKIESLSIK